MAGDNEDAANAYRGLGLKTPARERVIIGCGAAGAGAAADAGDGSDADSVGLGELACGMAVETEDYWPEPVDASAPKGDDPELGIRGDARRC